MQDAVIDTVTHCRPEEQSGSKSIARPIYPTNIAQLSFQIKDFIEKYGSNTVLYLEGIEYLVTQNNFDQVLRFIQHLGDSIATKKIDFIVSYNQRAFELKESRLLQNDILRFGSLCEEEKPNGSLEKIRAYIKTGKNLIAIMRDYNAAKELYQFMHEQGNGSQLLFLTTNQSLENIFYRSK